MNLNNLVSSSDQSIKIVPSTEDYLRQMGLNVNLDHEVQTWFNQLVLLWKTWRKSHTVENHYAALFNFEETHRIALVCVIKCREFKDCKRNSLPFYIIELLLAWTEINNSAPNDNLKLPAFHIATMQRNQDFLNMVVKIFHIKTIKEKILPLVKDIIKYDNCKQATQIVSALELYDDIPIEDLLFPLILKDNFNIIDEYLSVSPSQVKPLLTYLDSLLDKNFNIREYVQNFLEDHTVYHIKYDRLHRKPLGKLVARLCSKHNVSIGTCKNLSRNRTSAGLRYLIYQKYVEHNVSESVWDDLVKDSLNGTEGCAEEFINILIDYDHAEALKWAKYVNISENDLPSALRNLTLQDFAVKEEENWDDNVTTKMYYELPIKEDTIIMIDTSEKFIESLSSIRSCSVVSIDCEWKPSFGVQQSQVALIQIATSMNIYLFDTLIFNDNQTALWHKFNKLILENDEIIKIGFGVDQDLKEIKASVKGLNNIKIKGESLLDLAILWQNLVDCGLSIPNSNNVEGKGLSSVVQVCFGLPLEKSEQCSNWEIRPLRQTQIYYAALDAYVLLEIYKYLQKLCHEQHINFEEMCNEIMLEKKSKTAKKPKPVKVDTTACPIKTPKDLRLLVESELSFLMGYLRYCGIDTVATTPTMVWHDTIGLALSEDRNILTSKLKLSSDSTYPQSSILNLGKGTIKDQLQQILTAFNVVITEDSVLKRCIYCNNIDLKVLSNNDLQVINTNNQIVESSGIKQNETHLYRADDHHDNTDDFFTDSDDDEICISTPVHVFTQNINSVTSKGALIDLRGFSKVFAYFQNNQTELILLCESCGKFYWKDDDTIHNIHKVMTEFVASSIL